MKALLAILSIAIFTVGCTVQKKTTDTNTNKVEFTTIKADSYSGFQEQQNKILKTSDWLAKTWEQAHQHIVGDRPPVPKIDFSSKQVVLVALGMKNNGGFGIEVRNVEEMKNEIVVHINHLTNGPKCMTTQAIVFPFELISIPKSDKKVVFKTHEKVLNCP